MHGKKFIFQQDLYCYCIILCFCVSGRKTFQFFLSFVDFMVLINKFCNPAAIFLFDLVCRLSEICSTIGRIFLTDGIQGKEKIIFIHIRCVALCTHLDEMLE